MKVQTIRRPILMLSSLLISFLLVGCFGGGIDPTEDPVQPGEENEAANVEEEEFAEDNAMMNENMMMENEGNFSNEDMMGDNMGNNMGNNQGNNPNFNQGMNDMNNEGFNNVAEDNFLNGDDANFMNTGENQGNLFGNNQGNMFGNNNLGQNGNNGLGNNNFGLNEGDQGDGALINGASEDILESPNVNMGATDNGLAESDPDSVLAPVAENPTAPGGGGAATGGVVRYVTPGGSKLYDNPNGTALRNLEQGDHPLVNEEGEWSRTSDGYYVPSATLTSAPIARLKQPKEWR
ncbi:hypothetical protein [Oligoflexus tunisiensis]|uniref:hypothetical protein n=1 Tax=Oligoflexus tunisiensis TaxID=708132 RepID=UPI00114C936A|nr:hypothetical protein [Oligoflexus tunisiensis]